MVVGVDGVRLPEHLVSLLYLVDTPQKLSLQNQYFNVTRVLLVSHFKLGKCQVFVGGTNVGESLEINEFDIVSLNG